MKLVSLGQQWHLASEIEDRLRFICWIWIEFDGPKSLWIAVALVNIFIFFTELVDSHQLVNMQPVVGSVGNYVVRQARCPGLVRMWEVRTLSTLAAYEWIYHVFRAEFTGALVSIWSMTSGAMHAEGERARTCLTFRTFQALSSSTSNCSLEWESFDLDLCLRNVFRVGNFKVGEDCDI